MSTDAAAIQNGAPLPPQVQPAAPTRGPLSAWSVVNIPPIVSQKSFPIGKWFVWLALVVLVGLVLGGFVSGTNDGSGGNSTVVLALITGTAVVIERLLEAFWNYEDTTKGAWWPLNQIHDEINQRVTNFGAYVQPYLNQLEWARRTLDEVKGSDPKWRPELDAIAADLNALPGQINDLAVKVQASPFGNDQKLDVLLNNVSSQLTAVLNAHPDLQKNLDRDVDLATSLTNDVYAFADTFKDNPARRIISLVLGTVAGFVVALILRLDLFGALGVHAFGPFALGQTQLTWGMGVPLTGLIMGLGSNPTHEVIQAIQQFKQSK